MRIKLFGRLVMKAFNRRLFQRAIHPFDLAVGPGVGRLGEALLNGPLLAELAERMATCLRMMGQVAELNTIIGPYFMHLVGNLGQYPAQEVYRDGLGGLRP